MGNKKNAKAVISFKLTDDGLLTVGLLMVNLVHAEGSMNLPVP
jgi:hypothetical protein